MGDRFVKMHGLGNDFVIIDNRLTTVVMTSDRARAIADRRHGIGCDQIIVIEESPPSSAKPSAEISTKPDIINDTNIRLQIFNADGSMAETCGNALRCIAILLGKPTTVENPHGSMTASPIYTKTLADAPTESTDMATSARVTMGEPIFDWRSIPLSRRLDSQPLPATWQIVYDPQPLTKKSPIPHPLTSAIIPPIAVNIGNPHIVFFVVDSDSVALETIGPMVENDPIFPQRVNVNIVSQIGKNRLKLRTWERGTGLTRACGSGACASAVAAIRAGMVRAPVAVEMVGGVLSIAWREGSTIAMQGAATWVYEGVTDWSHFGNSSDFAPDTDSRDYKTRR